MEHVDGMRVGVYEKHGRIHIVLDGENNVILQSKPAISAFVIDKSILDNPKYEVTVLNNYVDFLGPDVMEKIRQGIAEGKHIKDVVFEERPFFKTFGITKIRCSCGKMIEVPNKVRFRCPNCGAEYELIGNE